MHIPEDAARPTCRPRAASYASLPHAPAIAQPAVGSRAAGGGPRFAACCRGMQSVAATRRLSSMRRDGPGIPRFWFPGKLGRCWTLCGTWTVFASLRPATLPGSLHRWCQLLLVALAGDSESSHLHFVCAGGKRGGGGHSHLKPPPIHPAPMCHPPFHPCPGGRASVQQRRACGGGPRPGAGPSQVP